MNPSIPSIAEFLSRLTAEHEAATKGPWTNNGGFIMAYVQEDAPPVTVADVFRGSPDAVLVASARNALPALVKMVEEAMTGLEEARVESTGPTAGSYGHEYDSTPTAEERLRRIELTIAVCLSRLNQLAEEVK